MRNILEEIDKHFGRSLQELQSFLSMPPLQKPFVIGGLGHGGHAHGHDEYVVVEGIRQFQKGFTHFLQEYSQIYGGSRGG